jgi:ketosteroid isomerase-like protein
MIEDIEKQTALYEIVKLERDALDRWSKGDPGGFLELYAADITYFDPLTPKRIDGHQAMGDYYGPWTGKICIDHYEMQNPRVMIRGDIALLTYNLLNYVRDNNGVVSEGSRWNSTAVYRQERGTWKTIHSHWSFTRHPAFQRMTPETSERGGE